MSIVGVAQAAPSNVAINNAKAAVRAQLKDGHSARFSNIITIGDNGKCVSGLVNAKNSFGAYSGDVRFTSMSHEAILDDGEVGFNVSTMKFCYRSMEKFTIEQVGDAYRENFR